MDLDLNGKRALVAAAGYVHGVMLPVDGGAIKATL